jgi:hypothetical protein
MQQEHKKKMTFRERYIYKRLKKNLHKLSTPFIKQVILLLKLEAYQRKVDVPQLKKMATKKKKKKYLKYSQKLAEYVLSRVEQGKTIKSICQEYNDSIKEGEPTLKENSIHKWKRDHPEFKKLHKIAYDSCIEYLCDYMMWLSQQPPADTGDYKRDAALLNQRKLEIDTLKFTLAKLNASRFKQEINVTGETTQTQIVVANYSTPNVDISTNNVEIATSNDNTDDKDDGITVN